MGGVPSVLLVGKGLGGGTGGGGGVGGMQRTKPTGRDSVGARMPLFFRPASTNVAALTAGAALAHVKVFHEYREKTNTKTKQKKHPLHVTNLTNQPGCLVTPIHDVFL